MEHLDLITLIVIIPFFFVVFDLFMNSMFYLFFSKKIIFKNLLKNHNYYERKYIYEDRVSKPIRLSSAVSMSFLINGAMFTFLYVTDNNQSVNIMKSGHLDEYVYLFIIVFMISIIIQFIRKYIRKKLFIIFNEHFDLENFKLK